MVERIFRNYSTYFFFNKENWGPQRGHISSKATKSQILDAEFLSSSEYPFQHRNIFLPFWKSRGLKKLQGFFQARGTRLYVDRGQVLFVKKKKKVEM